MVQKDNVLSYVNSLSGKSVDMDGHFGPQCMDLTIHVMKKYFNWWPIGNAIALTTQDIPAGFRRLRVTKATDIQAGDVLIWGLGVYAQYGHTAIATEDGRSDGTFISMDQNWVDADINNGSPAQPVKHDMDGVWGVIRPNYSSENNSSNQINNNNNQNNVKGGETTMQCLYERPINSKTGKLEWNGDAWTVMFCNGVNTRRVYHPDEMKVIEDVYKQNNDKAIPFYSQKEWNKNAPWYNRLESMFPVVK